MSMVPSIDVEGFMTAVSITSKKFKRLQEMAAAKGNYKKSHYYAGVSMGLDHAFELVDDFLQMKQEIDDLEKAEKEAFGVR